MHAVNMKFCSEQDEMYRAMYVTIDQENEHAVFLNTSALVDPASSNEQAMQMYYKPPFDEGGPSSNYSCKYN